MRALLDSPTVSYCETAGSGIIRRPWYALSNLAFIIAAYAIYTTERSPLARQFALVTLAVGVLSFIYDASYTYISQLLDLSGMLLFINLLIFLNLKMLFPNRKILPWLIGLVSIAIITIVYFGAYAGNIIFGLYVIGVVITEITLLRTNRHRGAQHWIFTLIIFAIGFAIWLLDATKTTCFDFGLINGRAIFHYASAFVMYRMFTFYRQQPIRDTHR